MDYVATREEIMEIVQAVKEQLGDGFYAREDKHRSLAVVFGRNEDGDIFGGQVYISVDEYKGSRYTAIGFRGESNEANGYSPAYASIIPHSRSDAEQFLRFAIACAFNKEIDI